MLAALTVVMVIGLSLLLTRVATVALTLTGLSRETSRFQARSALTGAGFTTTESEAVVTHPVRRRIVGALMLIGSAGVVTVVGSTALSLATAADGGDAVSRSATLVIGVALLVWAANSSAFDRALQPVIHRLLHRFTDLDTRDYASLLQVSGDFAVLELRVDEGEWLDGRTLEELRLGDEGVLVLGIQRGDDFQGAPRGGDLVVAGDVLIVYGRGTRLRDIDDRPAGDAGDAAHAAAVADQQDREADPGS